jgi:hypothetical protein
MPFTALRLKEVEMLTNEQIAGRLKLIVAIKTIVENVENKIVRVEADRVIVQSEEPKGEKEPEDRSITYDAIRKVTPRGCPTTHSVITRVLARILGIVEE